MMNETKILITRAFTRYTVCRVADLITVNLYPSPLTFFAVSALSVRYFTGKILPPGLKTE